VFYGRLTNSSCQINWWPNERSSSGFFHEFFDLVDAGLKILIAASRLPISCRCPAAAGLVSTESNHIVQVI
jgi:hypothetical protein